jgi:hypothetical protein
MIVTYSRVVVQSVSLFFKQNRKMKFEVIFVVLFAISSVVATKPFVATKPPRKNCGRSFIQLNKIHSSENSEPNAFPWLVAFYNLENQFLCSGSLISSRHVITGKGCKQNDRIVAHIFFVCFAYQLKYCFFFVCRGALLPSQVLKGKDKSVLFHVELCNN